MTLYLKHRDAFAIYETKLEFLFRSVCSKHVSMKVKGATSLIKRAPTLIFFLKEALRNTRGKLSCP